MSSPVENDYQALLDDHLQRDPALADDPSVPRPVSSPRSVQRRIVDRLTRHSQRALTRLRGRRTDRWWLPSRDLPLLPTSVPGDPVLDDVGVHLHVYFLDLLPELLTRLEHLPVRVCVYATTDSERKAEVIEALLGRHPRAASMDVQVVPNRGRDIGPWVTAMAQLNARHEAWCHLHTKKSLHAPAIGTAWREFLLDSLLGSEQKVRDVLAGFARQPGLGLVVPAFHAGAVKEDFVPWDDRRRAARFYRRLGLSRGVPRRPFFAAGTMCWYRSAALAPLFEAGLTSEEFDPESGQVTGTLMHVIERALPDIAADREYSLAVSLPA